MAETAAEINSTVTLSPLKCFHYCSISVVKYKNGNKRVIVYWYSLVLW